MILVAAAALSSEDPAVVQGMAEMKTRGGRLTVVHVLRGPRSDDAASVDKWRQALHAARERGTILRDEFSAHGINAEVEVLTSEQSVADAVLRRTHEAGATLIVIGVRQRSRVGKALMGSTAQEVLLGAECAVLTVPVRRP